MIPDQRMVTGVPSTAKTMYNRPFRREHDEDCDSGFGPVSFRSRCGTAIVSGPVCQPKMGAWQSAGSAPGDPGESAARQQTESASVVNCKISKGISGAAPLPQNLWALHIYPEGQDSIAR